MKNCGKQACCKMRTQSNNGVTKASQQHQNNNQKTMPFTFQPPEKITSDEGHVATVSLVHQGRHDGKWRLEIERLGKAPKIYHTAPNYGAARMKFAKFLNLPLSSTMIYIGGKVMSQSVKRAKELR